MQDSSWVKSITESYKKDVLGIKKPKVLIISIPNVWNINQKDLEPLKKIAEVSWIQTKKITQMEIAEKCKNIDHLMLNVDCIETLANKMERLDEKFYNHENVSKLQSLNQDMTDSDYFNPLLAKNKLLIQDCPNTTTESVAESAISEILLHTRKRHLAYTDELEKEEVQCRTGINLKGKIAGIIGYGNIGSRVAEILRGFGMHIMFYDVKNMEGITPIEKIFEEAKVISLHIPTLRSNGKSNINFINSKLLNKCKETILINLATDAVVDPVAASSALKSKKLTAYSVQADYSGPFGKKYLNHFKEIKEFHISPCSFDSPESQENIKNVWIQNTISAITGNPQNIWKN